MGEPLETDGLRDEDLSARVNELERIVQSLMGHPHGVAAYEAKSSHVMMHGFATRTLLQAPTLHAFGAGFGAGLDGRPVGRGPEGFNDGRVKMVSAIIRRRRRRDRYFASDMFADPAWDMMLDLYAAHYERREISVTSLCIAAAVPATTALRWIKLMVDEGHFLRIADPDDGRRIIVKLTDAARIRLDAYFDDQDD